MYSSSYILFPPLFFLTFLGNKKEQYAHHCHALQNIAACNLNRKGWLLCCREHYFQVYNLILTSANETKIVRSRDAQCNIAVRNNLKGGETQIQHLYKSVAKEISKPLFFWFLKCSGQQSLLFVRCTFPLNVTSHAHIMVCHVTTI